MYKRQPATTTAYITSGANTAGTFDILNQVTGANSIIRLGTNNSTATGIQISNTGLLTTSAGITATGLITANGGLTTGSVGIGISSPGAILDVSGDIRGRGEIQIGADSSFQIKRGVTKTLLIQHFSAPSASVCFINNLSGGKTYVGIDTTNPTAELDVNGTIRATNININGSLFNYVPWTTLANHTGENGTFANVVISESTPNPTPSNNTNTRFVYMYSVVGKTLYMNWSYYTVGSAGVPVGGVAASAGNGTYYYKLPAGYNTTGALSSALIQFANNYYSGTLIGKGRVRVEAAGYGSYNCVCFCAIKSGAPHIVMEIDYNLQGSTVYQYTFTQRTHYSFEAAIPLA